MAFYMAHKQDPENTHVERCLAEGYKVAVWPRNMPIDVKIEIVKHMNKSHDGIANTPADMITSVPQVEAGFGNFLDAHKKSSRTVATKGQYSYHNLYSKYVKENYAEKYST
eukprot:295799-Pyramimonas_sp.AAC.1